MNQIDNTKKYQNLYKNYKDLIEKTTIREYEIVPGGKVSVQISPEDLRTKKEVEDELKKGVNFLTDNQLIDLSGNVELSKEALEALAKRKDTM